MATWKNLDTLSSYKKLSGLKNHVDIAAAMSGEQGGERVTNYSTPMAAGLQYNYAAKKWMKLFSQLWLNWQAKHS